MLCVHVLSYSEKDSLGCLQHICGVNFDARIKVDSGLIAHHHHPALQGSQGRKASTRDCGGGDNVLICIYRHSSLLRGRKLKQVYEVKNKLLTYRVCWASVRQDTSRPSGALEDSESCKTPLSVLFFLQISTVLL